MWQKDIEVPYEGEITAWEQQEGGQLGVTLGPAEIAPPG